MHAMLERGAIVSVTVLCTFTGALCAAPSDLEPPPGPISPTGQITLIHDGANPLVINMPGSYKLGNDIDGVAGQNGIIIEADYVRLDLDGHLLNGHFKGENGIVIQPGFDNVTVLNGRVTNWIGDGVHAVGTEDCYLKEMITSGNGDDGIDIRDGRGHLIEIGDANFNIAHGIHASQNSGLTVEAYYCSSNTGGYGLLALDSDATVRFSDFHENSSGGLLVGDDSRIDDCGARDNGTFGGLGIDAGQRSHISSSRAIGNASDGIRVGPHSIVSDCEASGNNTGPFAGLAGIVADIGSSVLDSTASENATHGFYVDSGKATNSTAVDNGYYGFHLFNSVAQACAAASNTAGGFLASGASSVIACEARNNFGPGFDLFGENLVEDSLARVNRGPGFKLSSDCTVTGCTSTANQSFGGDQGTGYFVLGTRNIIKHSSGNRNVVGVRFDAASSETTVIASIMNHNTTADWSGNLAQPGIWPIISSPAGMTTPYDNLETPQ